MFKRVDHIELIPSNLDRTIKFYTEVLGFKLQSRRKMGAPPPSQSRSQPLPPSPIQEIAFIELNGMLIEMFSVKNPAPVSKEPWQVGYRRIALEVEDMDKLAKHLKSKGIEITVRQMPGGKTKFSELRDPDGLSIELMQRG